MAPMRLITYTQGTDPRPGLALSDTVGLDLLAADPLLRGGPPVVVRFAASGQELLRFRLAPPEGGLEQWRIVDFAVDAEDVIHVANPGMHRQLWWDLI